MRILLAGVAGLAATSAAAQITDVRTSTEGTLQIRNQALVGPVVDGPSSDYRSDQFGRGAGYSAFADTDSNFIYFEAGSMSAGRDNSSKSITQVEIDLTGDTPDAEVDRLVSTIFESTFGFYMGSFGEEPPECSGSTLPGCVAVTTGLGFSDFLEAEGPNTGLAGVSFSFDVLQDDAVVRSIGGSITMLKNEDGTISFLEDFGSGDDALSLALNGFQLVSNDNYAYVWSWDQTPFEALFANPIGFEESSTITYRITTESWSQARQPFNNVNMIIGFACFPDPIGRGGGRRMAVPIPESTCDDFEGDDAKAYTLKLPTIQDGKLLLTAPGIPEPATWAMMIIGFGAVGFSARRQRRGIVSTHA